ncbi:metal-dependent hydrolase [Mycobacterium sp. smrl_JER01]|uniref:metal-dependent hydrolase n=1 Tax=Mycobacterium sp. smrl_JER01 TaxID=3402633 RepID=UPI003ACDC35E
MSHLVVRHIPFQFDRVEFLWNRSNPEVAVAMNVISFWVIGLERYLVKTMKDADAVITDAEVRREAQLFLQQESVHTSCHRRHVKALIARYPGLAEALDKTVEHYDALHRDRDLRYLLAYAAALEGTFTPFFKMIIDNRASLFGDGDARVASLCLWHFCEEVEHRSSAVMVYDHVVGDPVYKIRSFIPMIRHVLQCQRMLLQEFQKHVPGESDAPHYGSRVTRRLGITPRNPFATVPVLERLSMVRGAVASIMPGYDHDNQPLPDWAATWFDHWGRGEDMTMFYGVRPDNGPAA